MGFPRETTVRRGRAFPNGQDERARARSEQSAAERAGRRAEGQWSAGCNNGENYGWLAGIGQLRVFGWQAGELAVLPALGRGSVGECSQKYIQFVDHALAAVAVDGR